MAPRAWSPCIVKSTSIAACRGVLGADLACRETTSYYVDSLHPGGRDGPGPDTVAARAAPGYARLHHPPDPALGAAPRLWPRADDPRQLAQPAARRDGLALSGPPPTGEAKVDRRRVGGLRERPASTCLHPHPRRSQTAGGGALEVGTTHSCPRGTHARAVEGERLMIWPWKRRDAEDRALDDEIRAHLAMAVADRIGRGESPEDALAAARREFGNVAHVKEVTRETWGGMRFERSEEHTSE